MSLNQSTAGRIDAVFAEMSAPQHPGAALLVIDHEEIIYSKGYGLADIENNQLFVWPYFAEMPLGQLTPRQEVELLRLVPAAAAREMKEKGKYTGWRLVIGADGTWHAFRKGE